MCTVVRFRGLRQQPADADESPSVVEKTFKKRSKSSTFVVASIIALLLVGCVYGTLPSKRVSELHRAANACCDRPPSTGHGFRAAASCLRPVTALPTLSQSGERCLAAWRQIGRVVVEA